MHAGPFDQCDLARQQILRRRFLERDARRPGRALIDPSAQQPDLLGGPARAFLRHDTVRIETRHELDDLAFSALSEIRAGAVVAALEERVARFEREAALVLALGVALDACRLEERLDFLLKIHRMRGRGRKLRARRRESRGGEGQEQRGD
jgi:hypothetical protein